MNDTVVLAGSVASAQEANHAQELAASFAGDPKKVVNMLGITGGQQVMLKVRIAEMGRNIAKQFGVNATGVANAGGVPIVASTSNPFGLLGRALSDGSGAVFGQACGKAFMPDGGTSLTTDVTNGVTTITNTATRTTNCLSPNNAEGVLSALEQVGLVHMLAEPNLTAVTGETARFLAGGEFPVPVARDNNGNITVSYKQFGVGLSFTPVVLSSGNISLQISTEASELTSAGSYQIGSGATALTVPALAVRRAQTTVELPSGGSFAIAGLMQHTSKQTIDGFPGAKDLPVLGALFRSRDFQNNETELVVLASVYLAHPGKESDYAAPTDGFVIPTDPETLLLGRLNAVYNKSDSPLTSHAAAPVGFVVR
jgi:pilus assembly protein CpaC